MDPDLFRIALRTGIADDSRADAARAIDTQPANIALRIENTLKRLGSTHSKSVESGLKWSWRALSRTTPISASENRSSASASISSVSFRSEERRVGKECRSRWVG